MLSAIIKTAEAGVRTRFWRQKDDAVLTLAGSSKGSPNVDAAASPIGMALPPLFGWVHFL